MSSISRSWEEWFILAGILGAAHVILYIKPSQSTFERVIKSSLRARLKQFVIQVDSIPIIARCCLSHLYSYSILLKGY